MPYIEVSGVKINFPYEPYPCQLSYMEKVIESLQTSKNGILESPTGTGKTLCLLCASLAWLENKKAQVANNRWRNNAEDNFHLSNMNDGGGIGADGGVSSNILNDKGVYRQELEKKLDAAAGTWSGELGAPKIIYASRTHSQLNQAIQELKRTSYSYLKACIIGSREQMCIHPTIMKETNNTSKVHMCRAKVSTRSCHFYNQVEASRPQVANQILDIEDLVTSGQKQGFCPYYLTKELKKEADIIFMPYNYVLDPKSRKAHGVELQGNILIFDEAHNLERICEESASFDLTSADIASAISDVNRILQKIQEWQTGEVDASYEVDPSGVCDYNIEDVAAYKSVLMKLEEKIDLLKIDEGGITKDGSYIFEILSEVGLTFETKNPFQEITDKMISTLTNDVTSPVFTSHGVGLSKFSDVLKIVFTREPSESMNMTQHILNVAKHYKVHVKDEPMKSKKKSDAWGINPAQPIKSGRTFSYWCFSPGYTMTDLKGHGVKVILLTSGTLSPLQSFVAEFGIDFPVRLENPHVIRDCQVWIGSVERGPDNLILSSVYENRSREDYMASLGNALVNFSRIVPKGLLIFFPSYPVMQKSIEYWQAKGIWERLETNKKVFIEPKNKTDFSTAMQGFYDNINDSKFSGAIFVAVCRGKVSEGLDFSDNFGRGVVITGLPYPPMMDARVKLKMVFLDEHLKSNQQGLSGQAWYRQQAWRAVNQAIGRVIRHREDFGAILLCDVRFSKLKEQLPIWLRSVMKTYTNFGHSLKDLASFFKLHESSIAKTMGGDGNKRWENHNNNNKSTNFTKLMNNTSHQKQLIQLNKLQKASTVDNHLPSNKCDEDDDDALLQKQYEAWTNGIPTTNHNNNNNVNNNINNNSNNNVNNQTTTSTMVMMLNTNAKDLLSALDSTEKNDRKPQGQSSSSLPSSSSSTMTSSLTSSSSSSLPVINVFKTAEKSKKIKILNPPFQVTACTKEQSEPPPQQQPNNNTSLISANEFLNYVKRHMGTDDKYNAFKLLLAHYKQHSNVDLLVEQLNDLLPFNDHNHLYILAGLNRFIKVSHREKFKVLCTKAIGQPFTDSCEKFGDIIADSSSLSANKNDGDEPDKKRWKPDPSHIHKSHTQQTSMKDFFSKRSISETSSSASTTSSHLSTAALQQSSGKTSLSSSLLTSELHTLPPVSSKIARQISNDKGVKINSKHSKASTTSNDDEMKPGLNTTPNNEEIKTHSGKVCPNCGISHEGPLPYSSVCRHACCKICWDQAIATSKTCPICSTGIKRRNITLTFFENAST